MWHEQAIEESLRKYQGWLYMLRRDAALRTVARALALYNRQARLIQRATGHFTPLTGFTAADVQGFDASQTRRIVNPFALGYGRPIGAICGATGTYKPGLIVVGTEHAYDPKCAPVSLGIEGCALSALWMAGADASDITSIQGDVRWKRSAPHVERHQRFQLDPSAFYSTRSSGHTWRKAAKVVVGDTAPTAVSDLFARSYLIEMSPQPARHVADGQRPLGDRIKFLEGLFLQAGRAATDGTRSIGTVWFHGKLNDKVFGAARRRLVASFMDIQDPDGLPAAEQVSVGNRCFWVTRSDDRMVVETHALGSSGGTNAYWRRVREHIEPRVAQPAPPT
jgi:hypothetical protein